MAGGQFIEMNTRKFQKTLETILRDDSRYAAGAYIFVRMALDFTVKRLCAMNPTRKERHVSSKELLEGIRLFALETFGPMAMPLFEEWGALVPRLRPDSFQSRGRKGIDKDRRRQIGGLCRRIRFPRGVCPSVFAQERKTVRCAVWK